MAADQNAVANLIWQIADLLRGRYPPPQYGRVMLDMTVPRRFDCILAVTKTNGVAARDRHKGGKLASDALDFQRVKGDPANVNKRLVSYIKGASTNVQRIFEYYEFEADFGNMRETRRTA